MWIIFEGLDKAGKTTLEWELLKATNFKYIVVDRGPVGYKLFDELFGRNTKLSDLEFIHQARKIMKNKDFLVVYVSCDDETAKARLKQFNEECPYDYHKAQKKLREYVRHYYKKDKTIEVDTTKNSVEECVNMIVNKIKEVFQSEL